MKRALIWIFAIGLTITAAIYQQLSGPTYPMKTEIDTGKQKINLNFPRSHAGDTDCELILSIADIMVKGYMEYRKYPTKDDFQRVDLSRQGDRLIAALPLQPVAGKLEYRIFLEREGESISVNNGKSVVIRFRGDVPPQIIIPHILLMFLAMLFSNVTGLLALFNTPFKKMTLLTLVTLFIGGLIFGPLVQKYAFNELWTGVPFGWDLTDNKTLIAFIAWLVAWGFNRTDIKRPLWVVFAAIMTILIFSIPHSMFGSELDPESGKIIQGTILPYIATLLP